MEETKPRATDKGAAKKELRDALTKQMPADKVAKLVAKTAGDLSKEGIGINADGVGLAGLVARGLVEAVQKTDRTTMAVNQALTASTLDVKAGSGIFGLSKKDAAKMSADKMTYVEKLLEMLRTAQGQRVLGDALNEAIGPLFKYEHVVLTGDLAKIGTDLAKLKLVHRNLSKHTEDYANFMIQLKETEQGSALKRLVDEEAPRRFEALAAAVSSFSSDMSEIQDHIAKTMTDRAAYAIQVTGDPTTFERTMKIANSLLDVGLDLGGEVPDVYAKTAITVVQAVKPWLTMIAQEIYRDIMVRRMQDKEGRAAVFAKLEPLTMAEMLIANQKRLIEAVLDTASPGLAYIPGWETFIKPAIELGVESALQARIDAARKKLATAEAKSRLAKAGDLLKEMADELLPISEIEDIKKTITMDVVKKAGDKSSYGSDLKNVSKKFIRGLDNVDEIYEKMGESASAVGDAISEQSFDFTNLFGLLSPALKPVITKVMVKIMEKLPFDLAAQVYSGEQLAADVQAIFMAGRNVTVGSRKTTGNQEEFERPTHTKEGHKVLVIHSSKLETDDDGRRFIWALVDIKAQPLARVNVANEETIAKLIHPDWETQVVERPPAEVEDRPRRTSKSLHISMFRESMAKDGGKPVYEVIVNNVWGWLDPQTRVFTPVRPDMSGSDDNTAWLNRTVDPTGYTEFSGKDDKTGKKVTGRWYWPFKDKQVLLFCRDDADNGTWVDATQRLRNSPMGGQGQFGLAEHLGSRVQKGSRPERWKEMYGA